MLRLREARLQALTESIEHKSLHRHAETRGDPRLGVRVTHNQRDFQANEGVPSGVARRTSSGVWSSLFWDPEWPIESVATCSPPPPRGARA